MYEVQDGVTFLGWLRRVATGRTRVGGTVLLLGLTSFLTDISSEMVTAVLPLYLLTTVGLTPVQFGVIDGIQQGASAFVRVAGGFAADRWGRHKEVAASGYALSAVSRVALIGANGAWSVGGVVLTDRLGKGIRTGPRDAMISLAAPASGLATAFGVHRALDSAGAFLGPLVAFVLLAAVPGAFGTLFLISFLFAVLGVAVIVLFVRNPARGAAAPSAVPPAPRITWRDCRAMLRHRPFRRLVLVGSALALVTISDAFLYLGLQRHLSIDDRFFPLLFVGTAAAYMVLAVPVGRLADRVGRRRVFLAGYAMLLLVYSAMLIPAGGTALVVAYLFALGAVYAATDGVLQALASEHLPEATRATGLAVLVTATSGARLVASLAFGILWSAVGITAAVAVFACCLVLTAAFAAVVLRRGPEVGV